MSIYDFKHQEVYYVDEDTWEKYKLFKDVNCEKYQLIRGLTMGEFYRTGEVD